MSETDQAGTGVVMMRAFSAAFPTPLAGEDATTIAPTRSNGAERNNSRHFMPGR